MMVIAQFCCVSVLACSSLLLLGRSVSGLMLLYCLLMATLLGPVVYSHCLTPQFKATVATYTSCVQQTFVKYSAEGSDEEYLPVTTSEDQALLTRVSDMHQEAYDSITNPGSSSDMVSGLALMPSHEEDSLASLSELGVSLLPLDPTNDSDSDQSDHQIKFQSGHFNDSSSEEEVFARDLEFAEADERDGPGLGAFITRMAVAGEVLGSVGRLAAALRPPPSQPPPRRRSSSDDDFEIINRDELS